MVPDCRVSRRQHHAVLGLYSLTSGITIFALEDGGLLDRLSMASAYVCLLLLIAALSIGPVNVLRSGRPLANNYLRRDTGIWAAVSGIVHLVVATYLSMTPEYLAQYVKISTASLDTNTRGSLFLWGSLIAYIVGILFVMLLALSSNKAMRWLGMRWWKRLQRMAYLVFIFTVIHAWAFQLLEDRSLLLAGLVMLSTLVVVGLQLAAFVVMKNLAERG